MRLLIVALTLSLVGCATGNGVPPQSQIPWDPSLITKSRAAEANRWAADVARRNFIEPYMNAICEVDGRWAKTNTEWKLAQVDEWTKLWTFVPIPNTPPGGNQIDWAKLADILVTVVGKAADIALVAKPRSALPPGLPPC